MSFNMSNGGESSFLELNSETVSELKLKRPGLMCSHPQQNVKLGSLTSWSSNDREEMYKKGVM